MEGLDDDDDVLCGRHEAPTVSETSSWALTVGGLRHENAGLA